MTIFCSFCSIELSQGLGGLHPDLLFWRITDASRSHSRSTRLLGRWVCDSSNVCHVLLTCY